MKTIVNMTEYNSGLPWQCQWQSRDHGSEEYGQLFFERATGGAEEMESSKAAAKRLATILRHHDLLADVGCGGGHYLRSLRREVGQSFAYLGLDATPRYIELARKAFANDTMAAFELADAYSLNVKDRTVDVTLCANLLLHLPTASKPLSELVRITRRRLLIRMLVSDASYVVKRVTPAEDGRDFDKHDQPCTFHYLNIYSEAYIRNQLTQSGRIHKISFQLDKDYDPSRISDSQSLLNISGWNATGVMQDMQRSGMLLMPWTWVDVELQD